ncbi:type VI toxin-antitoxin system SocA family antitoxin [Pararhizobium sp. LjRoot238]|uniref:type VI toxin-antitoxin system SocA family antitoxin n=1 Tax=Pararhizobium sp. LjRoot238 TaxID=3342293 RepID=UPI003ECC6BDF
MNGEYDPRAIANLMLDEADRVGIELTNLALQKLLYFAHGLHLIQTKSPLVSGYFEAWQYGPVHPSVYRAFKEAGSTAIKFRAKRQDPLTGQQRDIQLPSDPTLLALMQRVLNSYGRMSPGRLVDLSHAKDSPWAYVVDKARTDVAFGLRIPDIVILDRFRHHKVSIGLEPRSGEPSDDTPFT